MVSPALWTISTKPVFPSILPPPFVLIVKVDFIGYTYEIFAVPFPKGAVPNTVEAS